MSINLDQMYMDRMSGLLSKDDFQRIYQKVKAEQPEDAAEKVKALVIQFLGSAFTSQELLVSLIERVELTEEKEIIIKFRFRELEAIP